MQAVRNEVQDIRPKLSTWENLRVAALNKANSIEKRLESLTLTTSEETGPNMADEAQLDIDGQGPSAFGMQ